MHPTSISTANPFTQLAPPSLSRSRSLRQVAAAAKRRNFNRNNIGGGGRGRPAPTSDSETALLKALTSAVKDGNPPPKRQGFGGGPSAEGRLNKKKQKEREGNDEEEQQEGASQSITAATTSDDVDDWEDGTSQSVLLDVPDEDELTDTEYAEILGQDTTEPDTLAGADAHVEAQLQDLLSQFVFPLDAFQVKAVRHILCGRSVVVCAPTGAGKTAIAEASAIHFTAKQKRVIYTTPLKALSNQKLRELRERFGTDAVGLQTGDASINQDAPIVVMTTEILRNQLYRAEAPEGSSDEEQSVQQQAVGSLGNADERFANVGLVCLDECHYLGDPSRGSVWEEVIINLPPHVAILAMSATVRNPDDLSGWIEQVHGPCDTVATSFRPVPLNWHFGMSPGGDGVAKLIPLLDAGQRALNPALLSPRKRAEIQAAAKTEASWGRWDLKNSGGGGGRNSKGGGRASRRTLDELLGSVFNPDTDNETSDEESWAAGPRWRRVPCLESTVEQLQSQDMLPAIWFIFSRKECDMSAQRLHSLGMNLTTPAERAIIQAEIDALRADQPEAVKAAAVEPLLMGAAAHHAGCLPAWKLLIEKLFQKGVVKLVFATETLAAGINMPAKTTIISALSRRRDGVIVSLSHNELLQMAGRAGRRGYDTVGHCVILQSKWEDADVAWDIIRKGAEPLRSQFATSYGMALNLLFSRDMQQAREFLGRSFSQYLGGAGVVRRLKEADRLEKKAQEMLDEAAKRAGAAAGAANPSLAESVLGAPSPKDTDTDAGLLIGSFRSLSLDDDMADDTSLWARYQKLQGRAKEEKRATRLLRAQLSDERGRKAQQALNTFGLPRIVGLDLSATALEPNAYKLPALVLRRIAPTPTPITSTLLDDSDGPLEMYLCLAADNMIYTVSAINIAALSAAPLSPSQGDAVLAALNHAQSVPPQAWQELVGGVRTVEGTALTAVAAASLPVADSLDVIGPTEEGLEALKLQRGRLAAVKSEVSTIKSDRKFARASKRYSLIATKASLLLQRAAGLRDEVKERTDGGWLAFEAVTRVLEAAGAFEQQGHHRVFTPLGMVAREIRATNEVWLSMVLTHQALQTLPPPQLASVLSAIVAAEAFSRATVWAAYPASPAVCDVIEALEPARSHLAALQLAARVDYPIGVDLRMAGVVEAWASGASWTEVTADCGLDDGDVARLLTRTVDVLRQSANCDYLLPGLRSSARKAAAAMDRKPISDLVT